MSKKKDKGDIGHNSLDRKQLTTVVERIEKLQEEKAAIGDDIKDVYVEAKNNGYDNTTIKEMLKLRAMDAAKREEREHLRDLYMQALGLGIGMLD